MKRSTTGNVIAALIATVLLASCTGSAGPSPTPTPLGLEAITDALGNAGIIVADVADNLPRDGAWNCLRGSFRLARVSQQPAGPVARPGGRPSIDILLFANEADRTAAQRMIGLDGQVRSAGCGTMVDWIGQPHLIGVRNVIMFIATDDPAEVAAVQAAASDLSG
jgi:hypothetical protein